MGLFAKDGDQILSAWDAAPHKTYRCTGCNAYVRYRRSKLQFPHFYHLSKQPSCRLYSKSDAHLLIQLEIQQRLPLGETALEKPFPTIGRIADVTWEKKKIIFEIQCSMLSQNEAELRTHDYKSLGYDVIWILDDTKFNQPRVKSAESWMRKRSCYFVNNTLFFYDQDEIIHHNKRIKKGKKIPVDLSRITPLSPQSLPTKKLKMRRSFHTLYTNFLKKFF